ENAMDSDGIDSNGDVYIYGGNVFISVRSNGPSNAIDHGSETGGYFIIDGGTVIACGSRILAEEPDASSKQAFIMENMDEPVEAGSTLTLKSDDGEVILSAEIPCEYTSALVSCPQMQVSQGTYLLTHL
nr:hypothetical protein [Lachnospiraceae bacterium]